MNAGIKGLQDRFLTVQMRHLVCKTTFLLKKMEKEIFRFFSLPFRLEAHADFIGKKEVHSL